MNLEEIRAWNKRLKDAFPGISFQEDIHKYTIAGQEDRPIKSVSALMKYFYEEFDSDTLAEKYAKSRKLDPEDVKLAWAGEGTISTTHGTKVHLFGEDYIKWKWLGELDEPPVVFDKQSLGVKQFLDSLPSYFVPVASELQMYHPEHWYCGTADIIFYNEKTGKLSIGDFKGLEINTPILTTEGFKKMGDIEVGDMVYDPNGFPTRVKNTSKIKKKKSYKIKFDDNSEIIADFEHRWKISFEDGEEGVVKTTEELYKAFKEHSVIKIERKKELDELLSFDIRIIKEQQPVNTFLKFESIESIGECLTKCIEVESDTHMFLCGKELIPTHNTNKVIEGDKYSEKPLKHIGEKYGLDSSNLSKYSVQFSFYQLMLQNKGFEFDTRVLIHLTDDKFEKKLYKTYRTLDLTEDLDKWLLTKEHLK